MSSELNIGLARNIVKLSSYSPSWETAFYRERLLLSETLGKTAVGIEHVGSTSVPGLRAKPIIDIAVGVRSLADVPGTVSALAELGYEYFGDRTEIQDHFFAKGPESCRTYHLHMVEITSSNWLEYLFFRDYLRSNSAARDAYADLKRELAEKYPSDRANYTESKAPFICSILGKT